MGEAENKAPIFLETVTPDRYLAVNRAKSIVVIPFAPVEYHGRHLTFSTDLILAENFAKSSVENFLENHPDWDAVVHPVIPLGADIVPHPGSVPMPHRLMKKIAVAVARYFIKQGFTNIVLMSGHGGFNHDRALEGAAKKLNKRFYKKGAKVIAPLARVMFGLQANGAAEKLNPYLENKITPQEEKDFIYEIHGGWWETSMVLAHKPERMTDAYKTTPDYTPEVKSWVRFLVGLLPRITPERFKDSINETRDLMLIAVSWFWGNTSEGYLGFPAKASKEMGDAATRVAGEEFSAFYERIFLNGEDPAVAESVYSLLDLALWYLLGVGAILLVILTIYLW